MWSIVCRPLKNGDSTPHKSFINHSLRPQGQHTGIWWCSPRTSAPGGYVSPQTGYGPAVWLWALCFLLVLPTACPISGLQQATTHEPKYCIINQPHLFTLCDQSSKQPVWYGHTRTPCLQSEGARTRYLLSTIIPLSLKHYGKKKLVLWLRATMVAFNMGHGY